MYKFTKRLIDLLVASIILIILLPVFIPIVLLLRITAEGKVFYKQDRVGYKNRIFKIWKFATMLEDSPNMGTGDVTLRNDPRVTSIGKYLRMTKFNEFPQIINIFIGNMSLVGPRPLMKVGFDRYEDKYKQSVYNVKPGLTGIGSIAFRDEEGIMTTSKLKPHECYEKVILPYKGALEIWYQKNASLYTDIMILFLTAWAIIFPENQLYTKVFHDLPARNR